jgi:hypothetical protein
MRWMFAGLVAASLIVTAGMASAEETLPAPRNPMTATRAPLITAPDVVALGTAWRGVVRDALVAVERLDAALERAETASAFDVDRSVTVMVFHGDVKLERTSEGLSFQRGPLRTAPVSLSPDVPITTDGRDLRGQVLGAHLKLP